jgi:hypothetical protein
MWNLQREREVMADETTPRREVPTNKAPKFVPFTQDSLDKIAKRVADDVLHDEDSNPQQQQQSGKATTPPHQNKPRPNPLLVAGKQLPDKLGKFPRDLRGKVVEDFDDYYSNKYVSESFQ